MKKFNKIMSLLLVLAMVLGLAACGAKTEAPATTEAAAPAATEAAEVPAEYVDPYASIEDYDEKSQAIYADVLGEFQEYYEAAKEADSVAMRYALMAIAEAKLLGSGVFLPCTAKGGNYAMSCAAPYSCSTILWGNDMSRYQTMLVATEFIKNADRDEMKAKFAELKGTGEYMAWAKEFLLSKGYELTDAYTIGYVGDPQTWDILATYRSNDSEAIVNTFDYLVEYDCENVLQPALAESWDVSEDGTVYTFHLRQGLEWTDSQGRHVADLKADDFVAGMQHLLDCMGGLEGLMEGVILNASEYLAGDVTDFTEVGVKAVDDYTVEYTLCEPVPYFMTMLSYNPFAPMSREYYASQGGKFGGEFDASAATYKYGTSPDTIAYCGPYLVSNATAENTIVFKANPTYWNADGINIKTLTWLYNDGKDATKAYNDAKAGVLSGCGLNAAATEAAKVDGVFDEYVYIAGTDATCYTGWINVNRSMYANFNDETVCVSPKSEEEAERTKGALYNLHFRRAVLLGLDRAAYNAQTTGEELKLTSLINTYTPGNFVALPEDVTVEIGGASTTYAAGTYYGQIVQDQLTADGVKIKVWDPEADGGLGSSTQFDGWYNVDNANEELALAIEELAAQGLEVSAENPIYIDLPAWTGNEGFFNRAKAFKQSVEASLGGAVIINLPECVTSTDWYYSSYFPETGAENNYDIADTNGWGPDWGDPNTYLDTMLPDYMGSMTKALGIF